MLCIAMHTTKAQTLVGNPSNADINWVSSGAGVINGINAAMIDYYIHETATGHLGAVAYGAVPGTGGANPGGVKVTDFTYNYSQSVTYPRTFVSTPMLSVPDVIIGHNIQEQGKYIMAVGFINNSDQAQIDYYDIVYTSAGVFTVTYNTSSTLGSDVVETVHLDVIAEYGNLYQGLPICNRFFVVYDRDVNPMANVYDVFVAEGNLTARSITVGPVDIAPPPIGGVDQSIHAIDNWRPDVAGIEYDPGGGPVDKAMITWENQGSSYIYRTHWYPGSAAAFGGIVASDPPGNNDRFYHPRIDANDDYGSNDLATGANADYMIVWESWDYSSGWQDIEIWDEYTGGRTTASFWTDFTTFGPYASLLYESAPYNHYAPAIAWGPTGTGGRDYMVTEGLHEGWVTNADYFLVLPFDETAPTVMPVIPAGGGVRNYFQVNTSTTLNSAATLYTNAVATPPNNVGDTSLVAWAYLDGGGNYNIDYKLCEFVASGTGYVYKHSVPPAPQSMLSTGEVALIPNPATDAITVSNVVGSYSIKNMLGQVVLEGSVDAAQPRVKVSDLAKGTYILCITTYGKQTVNKMFVKD
ncbi:MAG: Secretion system C-terminal sorting domain [Flavipsychrobacter sp.]|nr:Secretion system C-terminal sorting domain [Flavipsychrobacter sp.]